MDEMRDLKTQKTLYEILGLSKNASSAEIKKAYHKLALDYHPDRNKDHAEKDSRESQFKNIKMAYSILSGNYAKMSKKEYDDLSEIRQRKLNIDNPEASLLVETSVPVKEYNVVLKSLKCEIDRLCNSMSRSSEVNQKYSNIFSDFEKTLKSSAHLQTVEQAFNTFSKKHDNNSDLTGFFLYYKDEFSVLNETLKQEDAEELAAMRREILPIIKEELRTYTRDKKGEPLSDGCTQMQTILERFHDGITSNCEVFRIFEVCRGVLKNKEEKYKGLFGWAVSLSRDEQAEKLYKDVKQLFDVYDKKYQNTHHSVFVPDSDMGNQPRR